MTIKTILAHLNDKRRVEALLEPTIQLAIQFDAHLIGLHTYAAVPAPPIKVPYASGVVGAITAAERAQSEAIAETFARMTNKRPFTAEWQLLKVPHVDLASVVIERGRTVDLIVAGQTDPDWDLSPLLDFPEHLALESGRPVLVVPHAGRFTNVVRNVVIAWKSARESARAVFDALPLLTRAANVHILQIVPKDQPQPGLGVDSSLATSLGRHGIKPTVHSLVVPEISVGDAILSRVADLDGDLLVMGAYGHSRMREVIFGGVTRHIARHMTVPTLFSH